MERKEKQDKKKVWSKNGISMIAVFKPLRTQEYLEHK